jgi:SapB morphogen precursor RamS
MAVLELQGLDSPVLNAKSKGRRRSSHSRHCGGGGGGGSFLSLLLC